MPHLIISAKHGTMDILISFYYSINSY